MLIEIKIIQLNLILNLCKNFSLTLKIKVMKSLVFKSVFLVPIIIFITVSVVEYLIMIFRIYSQLF